LGAAVDQNSAGSALAFATAIFRTGQVEFISKDREQVLVRRNIDKERLPINQ
jgi:hypothetical protein